MKARHRMLFSDLLAHWMQGLAIVVLLSCGIGLFVMMTCTMASVEQSRMEYYRQYRFADVFLHLRRAPNSLVDRFAEIQGVDRIQTRIVEHAILDVPNMEAPVSCRIVSLEATAAQSLNDVYIRRGRLPESSSRTEVVVSELFANAHRLQLGDEINVILAGRHEKLRVVGTGISPEYVYVVQPGLLAADNRRFGVLWMLRQPMAAAFNMAEAFNDVSFAVSPNAPVEDILHKIDQIAKPFGGLGAYSREDQDSDSRLTDELHQMKSMSYVTPMIFLIVASFLFNVVLTRMVYQQQEQIATMRAFGYTRWEIGRHYLSFTIAFVLLSGIIGCILGVQLSFWMIDIYGKYFRFPAMHHAFSYHQAILAIIFALAAAVVGASLAVRRASRLAPAVAMRPEPPMRSQHTIIDRLGAGWFLSPLARLIFYRLEGNPRTTLLSILGVAMGTAVVVLGSFMENTIDYVIDFAFQRSQRQDITLTFRDALSERALHDVARLPGVIRAEPFRSTAVRFRVANRQHRLAILGLEDASQLYRVLDQNSREVDLQNRSGIAISKKLSEILDVREGDTIIVEALDKRIQDFQLQVAEIFTDYMSPGAYFSRNELHRQLAEGPCVSGVFLKIDRERLGELYRKLKAMPYISSVLDHRAAKESFRALVSESTSLMRIINAAFACIIATGVLLNCALISLAERGRDLATLRVMGYTKLEVGFVLLGELAIITTTAIPIGLPIGLGFAFITTLALDTESHRFPLVVYPSTYSYASIVIIIATCIAGAIVSRLLRRLDLIAVLKVKE